MQLENQPSWGCGARISSRGKPGYSGPLLIRINKQLIPSHSAVVSALQRDQTRILFELCGVLEFDLFQICRVCRKLKMLEDSAQTWSHSEENLCFRKLLIESSKLADADSVLNWDGEGKTLD